MTLTGAKIELPRLSALFEVDDNWGHEVLVEAGSADLVAKGGGWFAKNDSVEVRIYPDASAPKTVRALEIPADLYGQLPVDVPRNAVSWKGSQEPADPSDVLDSLAEEVSLAIAAPGTSELGLRPPQAGGAYATLAHWTTGATTPATVVMPTGTGKTDTMIALFAEVRPARLLVIVPSQLLRTQIAQAFGTYGALGMATLIGKTAKRPVVGRIEHGFSSATDMRRFVDRCNVLVATPQALNATRHQKKSTVDALVRRCSHLFVDEAHHLGAKTWATIRDAFVDKPVVQFTATPFRQDTEPIGGKIVYAYPLSEALRLGYFEKIDYISVAQLEDRDRSVAATAVERLRADREANLDHLLMARVKGITRAEEEVLPIYQEIAGDLVPVVIHSRLSPSERQGARAALENRTSRIVVCVDMFGEGVDFPELKVAAIHDPHRSLGVALQFIGRFARSRADLGRATAVVSRPRTGYDPRLRSLYAEEHDWSAALNVLSQGAIEEVQAQEAFDDAFDELGDPSIAVQTLRPAMSATVYRTFCEAWDPYQLAAPFAAENVISGPSINASARVGWIVVRNHDSVGWGHAPDLRDTTHHLHVVHWDEGLSLLYIHTSELKSLQEHIAKAVCGQKVSRIHGEAVFRALSTVRRPTPTNIGVSDTRSRGRRFSLHVGPDVYDGFTAAQKQTKQSTNIFVVGFQDGERVTRGAAIKGRIWSQRSAKNLAEWVSWCQPIGPLLIDESLSVEFILQDFLRPKPLTERPPLVPIAIDWVWTAYADQGEAEMLTNGQVSCPLVDVELRLIDRSDEGPIRYAVASDHFEAVYEARVERNAGDDQGMLVHRALDEDLTLRRGSGGEELISEYLDREGLMIWFEHEGLISGPDVFAEIERPQRAADLDRLVPLDWTDIDIKRESQGAERDPTTVQARALSYLLELEDWDIVIDDDGTNEVADLVAIRITDEHVLVHLVHCKYSSEPTVGARVADLYEVCGQAHRSAHRRQEFEAMARTLLHREELRRLKKRTGLIRGSDNDLLDLEEAMNQRTHDLRVSVVQPGLSREKASTNVLRLIGAAELYVNDIGSAPFDCWCSP